MKVAFAFLLTFCGQLLAQQCIEINVLTHFNTVGGSGTLYGNDILKGVQKASSEIQNRCFTIHELEIGNNSTQLRKEFLSAQANKKRFYIGLGTSNKVKAMAPLMKDDIGFSPVATSTEFFGNKNVFLTSGTNQNMATQMATFLGKRFSDINIIFDKSDTYSSNLSLLIKKQLSAKVRLIEKDHDIPAAQASLVLLSESESAKAILTIDRHKSSKFVFGADNWGPKRVFINSSTPKLKHIESITQFETYTKKDEFKSDMMYYSYLSLKVLNEMLNTCEKVSANCLDQKNFDQTKFLKNSLSWQVKQEVLYSR